MTDTLFILKKVVGELSGPLSIAFFIGLIGLVALYRGRLKTAKTLLPLTFIWVMLLSFEPVGDLLLKPLEQTYPALIKTPADIDYVLVLGSGHKSDIKLPINAQLSSTALARLSEGIRHYNNLSGAKLVVSGYSGPHDIHTHASMQQSTAVALGVDSKEIVMLEKPKDTVEEAAAMKEVVGSKPFILVTSASHMPRAFAIFSAEGLNPIAAPTDYHVQGESEWLHMPRGEGLCRSDIAFHEYLGLVWEWVKP